MISLPVLFAMYFSCHKEIDSWLEKIHLANHVITNESDGYTTATYMAQGTYVFTVYNRVTGSSSLTR
jgi:hypothetical protein